jgi:polysaccharide biosynthesis/export protein
MKHRPNTALRVLLAAVIGAMAALAGQAQMPGQGSSSHDPGEPQLKINPLETLRNFEPAADEEYRLGRGDEITVDFTGRPDLMAKLVVGPDGRITLPLAGDLMLAGQTRAEAAKAIDTALTAYYSNLDAQVTVTKYTANKVLVLGAVEKPGVMTFEGTPTLLEALSRSGLETGPNKAAQIPERCAIYRGHDEVVWVDLKTLIDSGNPLADLRLRRDDVIYVPNGSERFVSVLGQVQHPGAVPLTGTSTLASVLANAGGFTEAAGNKPHIQIVDPATGSSRIISFNDLLNPAKALEIMPKPGEIIFVPQSGLFRATYVVERLSPLITAGALIGVGLP